MEKEKKTLSERLANDILSDNSNIEYCKQCKNCIFRDNGDVWSNHYTKSNCQMFKYPGLKPSEVINNKKICLYKEDE